MNYTIPLPPSEQQPAMWPRIALWVTRLLALVALSSGLYLSWRSTQAGPIPGCGGSTFDCDHVVTSAWSRWMGIPVSYLGCATYLVLLLGLFFIRTPPFTTEADRGKQRLAWTLVIPLAVMASLSAIWFTYLQVFEIGKLCPYCLVTHGCGLVLSSVLAVLLAGFVRDDTSSASGNRTWLSILATVGVCGAASLVLGQHFFPHETFVIVDEEIVADDDAGTFGAPGEDTFDSPVFDAPGAESADESTDSDDGFFMAAPGTEESAAGEAGTPTTQATPDSESATTRASFEHNNIGSNAFQSDLSDIASAPIVVEKPVASGRNRFIFHLRSDPIDVYKYPIIGSPEAKRLIVEVVDYTCHHCREMYHHVEAARQHYGNDFAVLVRPVALEQQCNRYLKSQLPAHVDACRYVRLALAVWSVDPDKFPEYHHWLMGPETAPDLKAAAAFAAELIGDDALRQAIQSKKALSLLNENHRLWNKIGGTLPYVFAGRRLIQGMPRNDEDFIKTLDSLFVGTP